MSAKVFTPEIPGEKGKEDYGVFLAGTIEMGNSPDWQAKAIRRLQDLDVSIYNPRRVVAPEEGLVTEQIKWELRSIAKCEFVFFHFCADTISPISLYELGLLQGNPLSTKKVVISCDPKYLRTTNIKVTLGDEYFGNPNIHFTHSFEGGLIEIRKKIKASLQYKNF